MATLNDVGTPWHIVHAAARDHGRPHELDVCAQAWSAKAPRWYELPEDGLVLPWSKFNHLNPRYDVQAAWMLRAAIDAERHGNTTSALVRAAQDTRYWFRLATSRATTDFYVGRISFIAPPEGVTVGKSKPRFVAGGERITGSDFASALPWYGPDYAPGVVRWRDAETGELIDVRHARELRAEASA